MEARVRRWLPVLVVVLALAAAGFAASGGGVSTEQLPPLEQEAPPPESLATPPVVEQPELPVATGHPLIEAEYPWWLTWPVTIFFLGIVVVTIGLFIYAGLRYLFTERVVQRGLSRQPASQPGDEYESEQMREALRAGLADIDAGGDPRRAVIACWLRLERAAAAVGTARLAADTPGDLVERLLLKHRVSRAALAQLAEAYRLARYAPATIGDELLVTARRALHDVDTQLAEKPPAGARQ